MASSDHPPSPPSDGEEHATGRVERLLRGWLETSIERFGNVEQVRQLLSDAKLPKEALALLLGQLEETKSALTRAVAKEMREFLENANLADELTRALTRLSFEIRTEVRFIPNESAGAPARPKVNTQVQVHRRSDPPVVDARRSTPPDNREET